MIRAAIAALALLASAKMACAEPALVLGGETFVPKYTSGNDKARLIEFVPPGETVDNWTQLVGYRVVFAGAQSARAAAEAIAAAAQARYPGSMSRVRTKGAEALVDFVVKPPGGDLVEFNVFKYAPGPNGRGVVSFQYARRFRGLDPADVRVLGARYASEVAAFDMDRVRAALARAGAASF